MILCLSCIAISLDENKFDKDAGYCRKIFSKDRYAKIEKQF